MSGPGYRCLAGDVARCRSTVVDGPDEPHSQRYTRVTDEGLILRRAEWYTPFPLGPSESRLLGDMAQSLGPERFRAFWTSNLPPAEAFASAAGQDIGAWTADWARRTYGPVGRGPGISASGTAFATLITLLALGGATAASRRRQVA
jgi:hypothetical protein